MLTLQPFIKKTVIKQNEKKKCMVCVTHKMAIMIIQTMSQVSEGGLQERWGQQGPL